ncbi:MAG: gamma-glutamyltransferase [Actinobacteria bacterium]|nr:gamma-glutamyltransferase [Actinomycetota bacterium]
MRQLKLILVLVILVHGILGSIPSPSIAAGSGCTPGVDGCLPTPEQCASGDYNGHWPGPHPGAVAVCAGSDGHVLHYAGGDASIPCGAIIEADVVLTGGWGDPNRCFLPPPERGRGVAGSRYTPTVRSRRGIVVAESAAAAAVGREILAQGGNAVDAAVATVFAYGVARPENCGIGGRGFLLYRGANGRSAALDFYTPAPAATRPDSMSQPGIHMGPMRTPTRSIQRRFGRPSGRCRSIPYPGRRTSRSSARFPNRQASTCRPAPSRTRRAAPSFRRTTPIRSPW